MKSAFYKYLEQVSLSANTYFNFFINRYKRSKAQKPISNRASIPAVYREAVLVILQLLLDLYDF